MIFLTKVKKSLNLRCFKNDINSIMPFSYRFQKILEIRIHKKEAQLLVVVKAQAEVNRIEILIEKNKQKIKQTIIDMRKSDPLMYDGFDKYLKHLYEIEEKLIEELKKAVEILKREQEILKEREKEVKVLEKHKENKKEEFRIEELKTEERLLNQIGSQRHFAKSRETKAETKEE